MGFLVFVLLSALSWGVYGPVLHHGQVAMGDGVEPSRWRSFVCVGFAYFLIAVVVPLVMLQRKREVGHWSVAGAIWSLIAGAVGAIGALGIILAHALGGLPVYIMPLVFGLAPVVNTLLTMWSVGTVRQIGAPFIVGIALVAVGGAGVMAFKPEATRSHSPSASETASAEAPSDAADSAARSRNSVNLPLVCGSILLTALSWGAYGPSLHRGQSRMGGSRLRPFLCVGLAYFAIAVILPIAFAGVMPRDPGAWNLPGTAWSLAGGALGALGALGIILAFNSGGKPIFVMPLVFGGAPLVNTLTTIVVRDLWGRIGWLFLLSVVLSVIGAVTVLVFAPRARAHEGTAPEPKR
jgi:hypothetical protein